MENFKFELIRADVSQQITHVITHKFEALTASELVDAFVDFASGCGFYKESLATCFSAFAEEVEGASGTDSMS
jgi:hypothetical protein